MPLFEAVKNTKLSDLDVPDSITRALKDLTDKNFGDDIAAWEEWWNTKD